ncbi:MAG: hypothetical protein ACJ796_08885 [Gemmatimonadaceae bacterium]
MKIKLTDPVTIKAAAQQFRVGYLVIRRGALRGEIRSERLGPMWLIERADARRYAAERRPFRRARKS